MASRLVRFDTGNRRLAVFASHTASRANGSGRSPRLPVTVRTTGVRSTAVVSRLMQMVVAVPRTAISR